MERSQRLNNLQRQLLIVLLLTLVPFGIAQNTPSPEVTPRRRVVVSIPDRKLAVLEGETVLRVFPVAVGADISPSPRAKPYALMGGTVAPRAGVRFGRM